MLEPLGGYLCLAEALAAAEASHSQPNRYAEAFNFGPLLEANRPVRQLIDAALHVGGPGAQWILMAAPHQRLGRQVKHHLRLASLHDLSQGLRFANVGNVVPLQPLRQLQLAKQIWCGVWLQPNARHPRPKLAEPQRQPAALEAGMPREQHPPARPELAHQAHTFQLACPEAHSSSSRCRTRTVSIGCQKPRWK